MPYISKYFSGGYTGTGVEITSPVPTVTTVDHNAIIAAHVIKMKGDNLGQPIQEPMQTVTASGLHFGAVTTTIIKAQPGMNLYNWAKIRELLNQYCGYTLKDDEILLIAIKGAWYIIADIGLRMLSPRELFAANGFPPDYIIERDYQGNEYGKTKQVARCGNAVPPPFATAIVRANAPEYCGQNISTMRELNEIIAV
jgi:DNA (cytosine-5)-methyltransferase 1